MGAQWWSGEGRSASGRSVHPVCADLSVELSGSVYVEDVTDLIWTTWEGKLAYSDEELGVDAVLAEARFATVDFDRLEAADIPLVEALDEYSQDFTPFCSMADGCGITDDLQDKLASFPSGMVVVERVSVPAGFRGRRYGLLVTTIGLLELGRGRVAVAMPAAFEIEPDSPEREAADRRNVELWENFGFVRFARDAFYLDTALITLCDNLGRFKAELEAADPITFA
jgi:hypothetical protein